MKPRTELRLRKVPYGLPVSRSSWGLGLRVSGFRVKGLGLRVSGFRVKGLGLSLFLLGI